MKENKDKITKQKARIAGILAAAGMIGNSLVGMSYRTDFYSHSDIWVYSQI